MKPTIGRKVLFWLNNAKQINGKNVEPFVAGQPFDATIVCVWDERGVNLRVTDHGGESHSVRSVTLRQEGDPTPPGMYCEWPAFQVRQAEKPDKTMTLTVSMDTADALERIILEVDKHIAAEAVRDKKIE
jgi:hypothetical protein